MSDAKLIEQNEILVKRIRELETRLYKCLQKQNKKKEDTWESKLADALYEAVLEAVDDASH